MICNPHAVGGATSRGRGVASGVGAGADDVQGLPFFLDILSTVKISRAKNPEGTGPRDRTGGASMWVRSRKGWASSSRGQNAATELGELS